MASDVKETKPTMMNMMGSPLVQEGEGGSSDVRELSSRFYFYKRLRY